MLSPGLPFLNPHNSLFPSKFQIPQKLPFTANWAANISSTLHLRLRRKPAKLQDGLPDTDSMRESQDGFYTLLETKWPGCGTRPVQPMYTLDDNIPPITFTSKLKYGLGALKLPVELIHKVIDNLDVKAVQSFKYVNNMAKQIVESHPIYARINKRAPNILRGLVLVGTGHKGTLYDLLAELKRWWCSGNVHQLHVPIALKHHFGPFFHLPSWERVCLRCIQWKFEWYTVEIKQTHILPTLAELDIPVFRSIPGSYGYADQALEVDAPSYYVFAKSLEWYREKLGCVGLDECSLHERYEKKYRTDTWWAGSKAVREDVQQEHFFSIVRMPHFDQSISKPINGCTQWTDWGFRCPRGKDCHLLSKYPERMDTSGFEHLHAYLHFEYNHEDECPKLVLERQKENLGE